MSVFLIFSFCWMPTRGGGTADLLGGSQPPSQLANEGKPCPKRDVLMQHHQQDNVTKKWYHHINDITEDIVLEAKLNGIEINFTIEFGPKTRASPAALGFLKINFILN